MSAKTGLCALVDGDLLVYRSAFACEEKEYKYWWKSDVTAQPPKKFRYVKEAKEALGDSYDLYLREVNTTVQPPEWCMYSLKHTLEIIKKKTNATSVRIFLGGEGNFRLSLFPQYKAGRGPRPTHYQIARDYLIEFCDAEVVKGQEADDMLGIEQTSNTVICSVDKDLLQIPGVHYNWVTDKFTHVTKEEGDEWFWVQMLCGDLVDNIKALDGIGPVKAMQLVQMFEGNHVQTRAFVQLCYLEEFKQMREFFLNARLLYIKREQAHETPTEIFTEVV